MPLKAVLFDLDNTLLLYSEKQFYHDYISGLYSHFRDLLSPDKFYDKMMNATRVMVANDGSQTNLTLFLEAFSSELNESGEQLMQRFNSYYENDFRHFEELMVPVDGVAELFTSLKKKGMKTVIATNPMFPMTVQKLKLSWVGLDGFAMTLITSVENSFFCKPNLLYYQSICEKIEVTASDCLMVGNDALNDMIASHLGMKTYLATDGEQLSIELSRSLAEKDDPALPVPDFSGLLMELPKVIDKLIRGNG
ncbi:MAG: HAD family hydrolase [Candidatus Marinimicrobia bacterium]|nr:HAD family hydrolase [Candidatus Neomarinimicrobiota bacterium]